MGNAAPPTDIPAQSDGARTESRLPTGGVLEELSSALSSAGAMRSKFLDLISIEARRAGLALMWLIAWGLVAAVCIVGARLGSMAALAMWAVSLGFSPIAAVIAVAVINFVACAVLIYVCIGMSRDLLFCPQPGGKWRVSPPQATRAMMQAPTLAAIYAAELRFAQSKRETPATACAACGLHPERPSRGLLRWPWRAGAAGLFGFLIARRPQLRTTSSSIGVAAAAIAFIAGLVRAFIVRYGMQHLSAVLQQLWATRQKRVARVELEPRNVSPFRTDSL